MAYISYNKFCESKFDNFVSKTDKVQGININQLKLEVIDPYKKEEKIRTDFEPTDGPDVINKAYLDKKISKIEGFISLLEKDYHKFKIPNGQQSVEEVLIQRAVKTTIQILYDKSLFDAFPNADKVLKFFCLLKDLDLI